MHLSQGAGREATGREKARKGRGPGGHDRRGTDAQTSACEVLARKVSLHAGLVREEPSWAFGHAVQGKKVDNELEILIVFIKFPIFIMLIMF